MPAAAVQGGGLGKSCAQDHKLAVCDGNTGVKRYCSIRDCQMGIFGDQPKQSLEVPSFHSFHDLKMLWGRASTGSIVANQACNAWGEQCSLTIKGFLTKYRSY